MALRGLALAVAACSLGQVTAEDPPCAKFGQGYNDPKRNSTPDGGFLTTPNGGFPNSSKLCQDLCANTTYCDHFTYYNNTKGCWLQGNRDDEIIESPFAISGRVRCSEASVESGFHWWMLLLALLAMLGCALLAYYFMGGTSEKKKKTKKETSKDIAAPDVEERAALMSASAAAPALAAAPLQPASMYYAPPAQVAVAPMNYSVASPVANVVMAPPQYVYQQTSSRQMMMVQPAQELFNRFDTDGDGRLSREELEAGLASLQQQQP